MKKHLSAVAIAAVLSSGQAMPAFADGKDVFLGAVLGAIANEAVRNSQRSTQPRSSTSTARQQAPSLNSQFSRAERIEIQSALANQGYAIGTIDGILGQNSRRVIGQWQASRGEAQTGQLTRPQYVALVTGSAGASVTFAARELNRNEVVLLQEGLQRLGFYRGGIDGQKGPGTRGGTNAFLAAQGYSTGQLTPVQTLVLARQAAGLGAPPYLVTEASAQVPSSPFGAPQQQSPFGVAPNTQQAAFGNAQQGQFGAPQGAQQAAFGAQQQGNFGAPQQGNFGAVPQQGQQAAFGAATQQQGNFGAPQQGQQQALFGTAPQTQGFQQGQQGAFGAPQAGQGGAFGLTGQAPVQQTFTPAPLPQGNFGAQQRQPLQQQGGATATAAQPLFPPQGGQNQAPASTLDIFGGTSQQPAEQTPVPAATPQPDTSQILVGAQSGSAAQLPVFEAPAGIGAGQQQTGEILFAPPSE